MQARSASNIPGIDVSHHQGVIDWPKVAASKAAKFVLIKATEGVGYIDPKFKTNAAGAVSVGLTVGFYHYARPETGNTAAAEAAHFVSTVKGYKFDLPLVLDVEGEARKLGKAALSKWCLQFLQEVKRLTGKPVMVYTGASFAGDYLDKSLAGFPLWVAHYGRNQPMANPNWSRWAIFQYTDAGSVPGIAGKVDMNVMEANFMQPTYPITKEDCDKITGMLGLLWTMENTGQIDVKLKNGVDITKQEMGRLADVVRKAAGQPTQNE